MHQNVPIKSEIAWDHSISAYSGIYFYGTQSHYGYLSLSDMTTAQEHTAGYGITLHPGIRELINSAATSAFGFPMSFFLDGMVKYLYICEHQQTDWINMHT